jgi:streptogramin lyase
VSLISSRWVLGTMTNVTHTRYGDSILAPRSIVTTIARASSTSSPASFATYTWAGGYVWGAQCGPNVFKFNFSTGVFDQIADPFGAFPQLAVGPNGGVWAIDTGNQSVAQYDPFSTFQYVIGCCSQQIQAGGDGVWILSGNQILRLDPSTLLYADVPGSLDSISVGSGGGVWGINSSHQVFAFSTP